MRWLVVALLVLVPLASAEHPAPWGTTRDAAFGFTPGPQVVVAPHVVQGEHVVVQAMKMPHPDVLLEVRADDGAILHRGAARLTFQSEADGTWWGQLDWHVDREAREGRVEVEVASGHTGAIVSTTVWSGPRIFVHSHEVPMLGEHLALSAVGFDEAPAEAVLMQGDTRAQVHWENARIAPGHEGEVRRAQGDWPEGAIQGIETNGGVRLHLLVLHPEGGTLRVWINGTVEGAPHTLTFETELPGTEMPRVFPLQERVHTGQTVRFAIAGVTGDVVIDLGSSTTRTPAKAGMALLELVAPEMGTHLLRVMADGVLLHEQELEVHAAPTMSGHRTPMPSAVLLILVATALVAGRITRRR